MALKSETLLQMPPVVLGSSSKNIMSDEKLSNEEDLEDGEIFDDEDDNVGNEATASSSDKGGKKQSDVTNSSKVGNVQNNTVNANCNDNRNNTKDVVDPDTSTSASGKATTLAAADCSNGNNNVKNEPQSGFAPQWKNCNANSTTLLDGLAKKQNSYHDEDKRSVREKKKKRKRPKDGDDEDKHSKEKRAKKHFEKESQSDANNHMDHHDDNVQQPDDEGLDDDDDEMLFIRGASPTMFHTGKNRRHRGSRDEDDEDDFVDDEEDDLDDEEEDDNDEGRRKVRLNDPSGRLDRAARRERLSARGKRRGRGGAGGRDSKRRKEDGEICIFYLQGKCHKGGECPFSHDALPHKKMELCKFYLMDCCNKKDKCLYMHGEFPCKYFHMGFKCYANKNCKFSHAKMSDAMRQVFIKTFGPINTRANKEFTNKKGSSNKFRPQEGPGDFSPRGRDNRRGGDGNKRGGGSGGGSGGGTGGGGGPGGPEKKIPSLFDIKVSIPTEMRNNANTQSDSDGNHTPMPSPPHMLHMSDSSRSPPPPLSMSPTMQSSRKRKKDRKGERLKKSDRHRSDKNENKRLPLMILNNDTNWDEMILEHQRLQQQFLAESCGNFAEDSDPNDINDGQCQIGYNQFTSFQHQLDIFSNNSNNSNSNNSGGNKTNNSNSNNINIGDVDNSVSDIMAPSSLLQRSPSPQNDSDTGGGLQIATQSNDSSNETFPSHLPKKQRELFLRIKQQQRQAEDYGNSGGGRLQIAEEGDDDGNENNAVASDKTDSSVSSHAEDKHKINDNFDNKSKQHDENWYSSDEDEEPQSSSGASSLTAILQNLVRMNANSENKTAATSTSSSSVATSNTNFNSIFNNIQPSAVSLSSSDVGSSVTGSDGSGVNINPAGISNVDFDINEVSELLSKVKQHFQSSTEKNRVRDPRLSRSDVGPNGDSPGGGSGSNNSSVPTSYAAPTNQNQVLPVLGTEDVDLRVNATSGNRGVGAGDMDLRNLPFKPAPVHSAATEIDASINSHTPLPYRLIPFVVPKPDYSSIQSNSKLGAADPRLRKNLKASDESNSVVSSRDPRHRLIDNINKEKTNVPSVQNSDPRQRARNATGAVINSVPPTTMPEEPHLPPSLMLSHLRATFAGSLMQQQSPGPDMGMMCPPTPRMDDEPPPNFMPNPMPARPTDPRQRHSQTNNIPPVTLPSLPPGVHLPPSLFDAMTAMQNAARQPNFMSQPTGDPRSRPPGVPNMPNVVFPGAVRSNDPMNRGQYGFK